MNIIYLKSLADYNTLVSTGSVVINGVTYTYDPVHDEYRVPSVEFYTHTVTVTDTNDIFNLVVVTKTATAYTSVTGIANDFTAKNIISVTGTLNNQNTDNECVLNFAYPKVSGTTIFGVSLVNAGTQAIRCKVLNGTVTDTVS